MSPSCRTKSKCLATVFFPSGWRLALLLLGPRWLHRAGWGELSPRGWSELGTRPSTHALSRAAGGGDGQLSGCLALVSPGTAARRAGVPTSGPLPGAWDPALTTPCPGAGWLYGERLRDGETGWFPEDFAQPITSRGAVEGNVRRLERLRVETDV